MHHQHQPDRLSTVDGFITVNVGTVEMIQYIANEPSVGLYFVQQHTHSAIPNLLKLQDKVCDKSRDTSLHTEDAEDSIVMLRSMKDCGPNIVKGMIEDIQKSIGVMERTLPTRGLIYHQGSGSQSSKNSVGEKNTTSGFVSTVFKSAKQKAISIKWPQFDVNQSFHRKSEQLEITNPPPSVVAPTTFSALPDTEAEELPLSIHILDDQLGNGSSSSPELSENYEKFKACREAKLQEWLNEHVSSNESKEAIDSFRPL